MIIYYYSGCSKKRCHKKDGFAHKYPSDFNASSKNAQCNGGEMTEASKLAWYPHLKKSTLKECKTVKDIDQALRKVDQKYNHFGEGFASQMF